MLGSNLPSGTKTLIKIYDDLRHLGLAKHDALLDITEETLCEHLKVAQQIWVAVLEKEGHPVTDEFRHSFVFE